MNLKKFVCITILFIMFQYLFGQSPELYSYNVYKYSYSLDSSGKKIQRHTFTLISPFIMRGKALFNYMYNSDNTGTSSKFGWIGDRNGWHVYACPNYTGMQNSYFLISKNLKTIRIQQWNANGVTDVYTICDPNKEINNAPIY